MLDAAAIIPRLKSRPRLIQTPSHPDHFEGLVVHRVVAGQKGQDLDLARADAGLFWELCGLGSRLVGLHLLEASPALITSYPVAGSDEVDQVR